MTPLLNMIGLEYEKSRHPDVSEHDQAVLFRPLRTYQGEQQTLDIRNPHVKLEYTEDVKVHAWVRSFHTQL
jgi:hypothetical protein